MIAERSFTPNANHLSPLFIGIRIRETIVKHFAPVETVMQNPKIGTYIEFIRGNITNEVLSGFVLDFTNELTLLHRIDGNYDLAGYTVFRNSDVTAWTAFDDPQDFRYRALRLMKLRPRHQRSIDISCWHQVFETVSRKHPLIVLYREVFRPDSCWVGHYLGFTPKTVSVHEIDPTARWDKPTRYRLADITRIEFAGRYEEALWRVASEDGPPPWIA